MSKSRKSSAWAHFKKIEDNRVPCGICGTKLSYHDSMSTMISHLKLHPTVKVNEDEGPTQSSMATFIHARKCDRSRSEKTSALIASMVAKDMLPISTVEGRGFPELMAYIELEYTVQCRRTITSRLEKMNAECSRVLSQCFSQKCGHRSTMGVIFFMFCIIMLALFKYLQE